ncbi:zinc ribbon domain-containing protein [Ruminococcus sp.]|uniref:zinc ribbon domain-containing protein n=1 Tax=Ruminococcus sp. TaxID=41978 RepID=UPI0025F96044|nr:zinc ribbon domain-containing protein [Ruminococcus sp.]
MRICPKCGSRINDDAKECQVCEKLKGTDRENYKRTSFFLFFFSLVLASVYVLICAVHGIIRLSSIDNYTFLEYDSLIGSMEPHPAVIVLHYLVFGLLLPLSFGLFIVSIALSRKVKLLIPFTIVGIVAEFSQILMDWRNYLQVFREKDRFLYGIIGMDIFSALLVLFFFGLMIWMLSTDFTISQSRLLIAFGFVLVASRFLLKIYMSDDPEILRFVSATKSYILLSAMLVNSWKRYNDSRNM